MEAVDGCWWLVIVGGVGDGQAKLMGIGDGW